jgi:Na+-transporting NADH:ubiquinone oxidoreductase subunit B
MVAVGVVVGIFFAKEVFGGTGMNIMNPALACRAFLFFGFPGRMTGDVWVGTNAATVRESLVQMNQEANKGVLDGYSQATGLSQLNVSHDIKRIHVDAIASNDLGSDLGTLGKLQTQLDVWNKSGDHGAVLGQLDPEQLKSFVTSPLSDGGLGLASSSYDEAYHLADLSYGISPLNSDGSFFFGNKLGCMGETSVLACLLGALILIWTGVGSWRTMVAVGLGAFLTASIFEWGAKLFGIDGGVWNPAVYAFPAYKHLLLGGLMFGLVFMATDPVSSPTMNSAKWIFGIFIGIVAIVIRLINPAFPEGVMLAIIMGNVFAPLFDYYAGRIYRKRRRRVAIA